MNKQPPFKYGKTIGIVGQKYGDIRFISEMIERLLFCMKESNQLNGEDNEFFRLDFRTPYFDELDKFPRGSLILDLKWGCKTEKEEA